MDYIQYLRSKVGHDPIILVGSSVVVINEKNEVLLQLRKDNNLWGLPGGSMELGESFEETAIREVKEETGLLVTNLKLLELFSGKELHYIYPNGDEAYSVIALFESRTYQGDIVNCENESKDIQWFDIDSLPESIAPPTFIKDFLLKRYNVLDK